MILAVTGAILMIVGIAIVVIEAGKNWNRWRGAMRDHNTTTEGKISCTGLVILVAGVMLALIGTSGSPPPKAPAPPTGQAQ